MNKQTGLYNFILAQFTSEQLVRWLSTLENGRSILADLPGGSAGAAHLVFNATDLLHRHGIVLQDDFWDSLSAERPNFRAQIDELKAMFLPNGRPTRPSTPAPNPSPPPHVQPLLPPRKKLKILMVSASPDDQVRLRVDKEFRDIVARLERTFSRDLLQVEQVHAATLADLRTALLRHEPHVLHLSCHGETNGDIVLEGKEQSGQRVVKADILRLLRTLRDNLCLVFLNACHSHVLASEIPPNIDLAIGMNDEITDAAAMDIAVAFYETLAYGRTVETAFDVALVGLSGLAQDHVPALFPPANNDPGHKRSIRLI